MGSSCILSQSTYGKNAEIWINNSSAYTTGCAGSSVSAAVGTACDNTYDTTNGLQASTTGNIYGIYDMVGGANEYTSSYVNNGHANLNYGSSIISADNKYKDIYLKSPISDVAGENYYLTINRKGDAIYETSATPSGMISWYNAGCIMPKADQPWFVNGGTRSETTNAEIFRFTVSGGNTDSGRSFRITLMVNDSL
jgi:hypothetical protein